MKVDSRQRAPHTDRLATVNGPQIGMPQALRASRPDREARAFLRRVNLYAWL